MHFIYLRN